MALLRFESYPLWINLVAFCVGAVAIWLAGTRLSRYADALAERTGIGRAFIGALLLGGITSLPEAATTLTASATGSVPLAVNNIFGGVAMQVAVLSVADAVVPGRAISTRLRGSSVLLEAALLILVLTLATTGMVVGEVSIFGVGAWSAGVLGASVVGFFLLHQDRSRETWEPEETAGGRRGAGRTDPDREEEGEEREEREEREGDEGDERSTTRLVLYTAASAVVILAAGFVLARSADALALQTGLGQSFVGMLFLAIATSLPEVSTTIAAARLGQFTMAFSNIFGANILDLAILFLADLASPSGPVLDEVGQFSIIGALLGVLLTGIFLVGLLQRRKRVVLGMGLDSILVLVLYLAGMGLLYTMR